MKKVVSVILGLFLAFSLCVFPEVQTANALSTAPSAVCMSYYSDIYSRGFAWQTTTDISETKLMLVKDNGSTPDWQNAEVIEGTRKDFLNYRYHKAQVENLTPGAKYYYRVGGNGVYSDIGSFTVEQSEVKDVSFVYVTDSQ
ncbi:MAG: fibronectin type III domain-containing protein, partial [Clostridia bacterium]|nr:fibronectin type III domain-containing protein [Clostridia bacterium]